MPKRPSSPAQIASRFTYFLKGDLKRKEQLFILIAEKLVRVRDENLWQTLKHPSIEDYARKRLGLQKTSLYNYLQIHDWLKEFHPAWLARKPKGFIPDLTDSSALMWIEKYLRADRTAGARWEVLDRGRRRRSSDRAARTPCHSQVRSRNQSGGRTGERAGAHRDAEVSGAGRAARDQKSQAT